MSRRYTVIYAPEALDDLRGLYAYIAFELHAPQAAFRMVNRIRAEIRGLERFPEKHRCVSWEPWASQDMRSMPVRNYMVYYSVDKERFTVSVFRIFYGGRDVEHIIQEEKD